MCVREHYLKNDEMERLVRTVSNEIHGKLFKFFFFNFPGQYLHLLFSLNLVGLSSDGIYSWIFFNILFLVLFIIRIYSTHSPYTLIIFLWRKTS